MSKTHAISCPSIKVEIKSSKTYNSEFAKNFRITGVFVKNELAIFVSLAAIS